MESYLDLPKQISAKTTRKILMLLCDESVRLGQGCFWGPRWARPGLGSAVGSASPDHAPGSRPEQQHWGQHAKLVQWTVAQSC